MMRVKAGLIPDHDLILLVHTHLGLDRRHGDGLERARAFPGKVVPSLLLYAYANAGRAAGGKVCGPVQSSPVQPSPVAAMVTGSSCGKTKEKGATSERES